MPILPRRNTLKQPQKKTNVSIAPGFTTFKKKHVIYKYIPEGSRGLNFMPLYLKFDCRHTYHISIYESVQDFCPKNCRRKIHDIFTNAPVALKQNTFWKFQPQNISNSFYLFVLQGLESCFFLHWKGHKRNNFKKVIGQGCSFVIFTVV